MLDSEKKEESGKDSDMDKLNVVQGDPDESKFLPLVFLKILGFQVGQNEASHFRFS